MTFWASHITPNDTETRVLLEKGVYTDDTRGGRVVPWKAYYPVLEGAGKLPVLVWSHGLGGTRDGAGFLARYVASHGYVVLNVQHRGTDSSLWEGKPGHPWDAIRATEILDQDVVNRYKDIPFVLDCLAEDDWRPPKAGPLMDLSNMMMSGHSFGALTTQVMAGQVTHMGDINHFQCPEPRFKAGIVYSPIPSDHPAHDPDQDYRSMNRFPLFFMTGTQDVSPLGGFAWQDRLSLYERSTAKENRLLVLEEGDHMVFVGSRGQLGDSPHRERHEEIIKIGVLAYLDSVLKEDKTAQDWLDNGGFENWLAGDARYSVR